MPQRGRDPPGGKRALGQKWRSWNRSPGLPEATAPQGAKLQEMTPRQGHSRHGAPVTGKTHSHLRSQEAPKRGTVHTCACVAAAACGVRIIVLRLPHNRFL